MIKFLFRVFILLIAGIMLHSCYGSNHLTSDFGHGPIYSRDSGMIAFTLYPKVFKPAKGISRVPDGGISKTVYSDLIVYLYDIENHTLKKVHNFGELPYHSRSSWHCQLQFADDFLYFSLKPSGGWENSINVRPKINSALMEKKSGWFIYKTPSGEITKIDSVDTSSFNGMPAKFSEMTELLKDYTWADYGLFLSEILPDTKKVVLKDLEKLEGNKKYREAIIEQYVKNMDSKKIKKIIHRIEKNTAKFSDNEMRNKQLAKNETLEKLYSLLD